MHLHSLHFASMNRTIAPNPTAFELDKIASIEFQMYYRERSMYHMYTTLQYTKNVNVNHMERS